MVAEELVQRMHADYMKPMSLAATARLHGRCCKSLRELFERRGYALRPYAPKVQRLPNGCFPAALPLTSEEIDELIASAKKLAIPAILRREWRSWPMDRRADFIARVRRKLNSAKDRPTTPFSSNVEPFEYASARAREIAAKLNQGLDSRHAAVKIDLCSQGVIWNERLWFWSDKVGYVMGPWSPENGRPALHHVIWEKHNRRKIPAGHVVRFKDGNRNNHAPENLILASRNELCRENQSAALTKKSRQLTSLLLNRNQGKKKHAHTATIKSLKAA